MAKGKKTVITEIKLLKDDVVLINGKEYILIENKHDVLKAKTMKISSNGNRILRYDDENKKSRIDVLRAINIVKYTITNEARAKSFKKNHDKNFVRPSDKKEIIGQSNSYTKANEIIETFTNKESATFDKKANISIFYVSEEIK